MMKNAQIKYIATDKQILTTTRRHSRRLQHYRECMVCKKIPAEGIALHAFPLDDYEERASWPPEFQSLVPRYKKALWVKLCSLHFKQDCFEDDGKTKLKPQSVPTVLFPLSDDSEDEEVPIETTVHAPGPSSVQLENQSPVYSMKSSPEPSELSSDESESNSLINLSEGDEFEVNLDPSLSVATVFRSFPMERTGSNADARSQSPPTIRPWIDCRISQRPAENSSDSSKKPAGTSSADSSPTAPLPRPRTSKIKPNPTKPSLLPSSLVLAPINPPTNKHTAVPSCSTSKPNPCNDSDNLTLDDVHEFLIRICLTPSETTDARLGKKVFILDKPMVRYEFKGINLFLCRLCPCDIFSDKKYVQHDCIKVDSHEHFGMPLPPDSCINIGFSLVEIINDTNPSDELMDGKKPKRRFAMIPDDQKFTVKSVKMWKRMKNNKSPKSKNQK